MRAVTLNDFGEAPALRDVPTPTPGPGEVLVRVRASSVNGFDLAVAGGMIKPFMEHIFPLVLGRDFAGTVEANGPGATRFAVGDPVYGFVLKQVIHDGAFGEFLTIGEHFGVTRIPDGVDFAQAGALALAGVAALMSVEAIAPEAGETVLIAGATGGVGAYATQMVVARGARVIATARPGKEADFVQGLGASDTIAYGPDAPDVTDAVRSAYPNGVDAVIHLAGDGLQLATALVAGGRIASTLLVNPEMFAGLPVKASGIVAVPEVARLDRLAGDMAAGRLHVAFERTYQLDEVAQAFADFAAGTLGKLGVNVG